MKYVPRRENEEVVQAAEELMEWINGNVGLTADWPAGFSTDSQEAADEWCRRLNTLQSALKAHRERR